MDYLRDEVRSGFYIPTAIKQAWAAQLRILAEIDRICEKHGINYFAEWGTLLGTVRHGGYVPWDDDFDIGMLREDYNKFLKVAASELPKEFDIHNYKTKENHWLFLARVVNSNHICFDKDHLDKYNNFPYIATVDVFVLDYRYADDDLEIKRTKEIKHLLAVAEGIIFGGMSEVTIRKQFDEIEYKYNVKLDRQLPHDELGRMLYALAEKVMSCVRGEDALNIVQMFPWGLKGSVGLPKEYYESFIRLPFENTTIPVPKYYESVLGSRYGNYMEVRKVWGGHDYPYFEGQRANLRKVADFDLPEFAFDLGMLRGNQQINDKSSSLKSLSLECLNELKRMAGETGELLSSGKTDDAATLLVDIQNLAIDLGTLIENVKGADKDNTKKVIKVLEDFCELAYSVHEGSLNAEGDYTHYYKSALSSVHAAFLNSLADCSSIINKNVIERNEVLFVSNGPECWPELEKIYLNKCKDDNLDVVVINAPMFRKDVYGNILSTDAKYQEAQNYECERYPEGIELTRWDSYDISLHCPEEIYIQNPYDGENPCLTVPSMFYASNLQQYTEHLVYVPTFKVGEFGQDDTTDLYNMKHYVNAPGVIRADEILVQSDNTKQRYVESLTGFCGEATRQHWLDCVKVNIYENNISNRVSDEKSGKMMVYCIGINELTENRKGFLNKVSEKLEVFKNSLKGKSDIQVNVCTYPELGSTWYDEDIETSKKLEELLKQYDGYAWCHIIKYNQAIKDSYVRRSDAYYGSPTPLAHKFNYMKKSVLISSKE